MASLKVDTAFFNALIEGVDKNKKVFRRAFFGPLLKGLAGRFIRQNYDAGGRPVKWPELNAAYLRRKKREGYPAKILVRTGKLRRGVTSDLDYVVKGNQLIFRAPPKLRGIVEIHSRGLVGGGKAYAFDPNTKKWGVPKRPVLQLTSAQTKRLEAEVRKVYKEALNALARTARTGRPTAARIKKAG